MEARETGQFYMVDSKELSEREQEYLAGFIEGEDSMIVEDLSVEHSEEIQNLKSLITDLRQDRLQLQHEIDQFRCETYPGPKPDFKLKTMQDDIEFFSGENLELQQKVKEVCLHNAQLKLQIAEMAMAQRQQEINQEV